MAIALTPRSPLPATTFSLLLHWFEELLRVLSLILCHALLAGPLHLTRCRKTFFTADDEVAKLLKIAIRSIDDEALQRQYQNVFAAKDLSVKRNVVVKIGRKLPRSCDTIP